MPKYVYYNAVTLQVEAVFETPELPLEGNWEARGFKRAVVAQTEPCTRNCKITQFNAEGEVTQTEDSLNSINRQNRVANPRYRELSNKLSEEDLTSAEFNELARFERGYPAI